jgi:hypothetical protein
MELLTQENNVTTEIIIEKIENVLLHVKILITKIQTVVTENTMNEKIVTPALLI